MRTIDLAADQNAALLFTAEIVGVADSSRRSASLALSMSA